jgi:hypothetical protein
MCVTRTRLPVLRLALVSSVVGVCAVCQYGGTRTFVWTKAAIVINSYNVTLITGDLAQYSLALQQLRALHSQQTWDGHVSEAEKREAVDMLVPAIEKRKRGWVRREKLGHVQAMTTSWYFVWLAAITVSTLLLQRSTGRWIVSGWRTRRGLCASCGYDLTGNVSGKCPECGLPTEPSDESLAGD